MSTFDLATSSTEDLPDFLLISASAGTGKTWTITEMATRWLLETNGSPSRVLMVTFSRAAASELKAKLRERVTHWRRFLADYESTTHANVDGVPEPDAWAFARQLVETIGLDELRRRQIRVLRELDGVGARTIHSFAGAVAGHEGRNGSAASSLLDRAVAEELMHFASRQSMHFDAFLDAVRQITNKDVLGTTLRNFVPRLRTAISSAVTTGDHDNATLALLDGLDDYPDVAESLRRLITSGTARLEAMRREENVLTFDSMITDLARDVTADNGRIVTRLRDMFDLVMIDEFQDTDLVQWQIFNEAFRDERYGPPVKMVVVGDPKQSIYGFRGGDVEVFREQERLVLSDNDLDRRQIVTLPTNRRSVHGVVAALNGLFLAAQDSGWTLTNRSLESANVPAPYQPVQAVHPGEGHFEIRRTTERATKSYPIIAEDVANEVVRLLREGEVPESIAVLCRRGDQLAQIGRALSRRGVKTVNVRVADVFTTTAADQIRLLLWILEEPTNSRRTKLSPALWFDLDAHAPFELARALADEGFSGVLRRIMNQTLLSTLLVRADGERHITDLEHLGELVTRAFPSRTDPLSVRRWLERMHATASEQTDDESGQRRIESDAAAVRLTTAHSAKGLQWRNVLVADLVSSAHPHRIDTWTTAQGRQIDVGSLIGASREENHIVATARENDEMKRLIYVALTRAEFRLIAWVPDLAVDDDQPWRSLVDIAEKQKENVDELQRRFADAPIAWPVVTILDSGAFGETDTAPATLARPPRYLPTYRRSPFISEHSRRWSYSDLAIHGSIPSAVIDSPSVDYASRSAAESPESPLSEFASDPGRHVFGDLRGASFGEAAHEVFESIVGVTTSTLEVVQSVVRNTFIKYGWDDVPENLPELFHKLLTRSLGSAFDQLSLDDLYSASTRRVSNELRFTMPLGSADALAGGDRLLELARIASSLDASGPFNAFFNELADAPARYSRMVEGFLTGSIDLVADVGEGDARRFVILDYKTNGLSLSSNYRPASLLNEMGPSGYPLQALIYSVALHRYLRSRLPEYNPQTHLGGALYYYLRGAAVDAEQHDGLAFWAIPPDLTIAASDLLNEVSGR